MPALTYERLVAELFPRLTGGIRWGLDRTRRMLADAGDPHLRYRVVHVGGTNGKGSVAAHIESVLRGAGHRTGLYTSPHLCSFRERVRIDGCVIGADALVAAAERLWPSIVREAPSFFEATTVIAFQAMADAGVDTAVVEVGLGGRLDATNVVHPDAVVLTNVSLDHVQLLGPTVEHVAREKAGIMKAGVPVITGESAGAAHDIFRAAADAAGAPLRVLRPRQLTDVRTDLDGTRCTVRNTRWGDVALHTPLPGAHQAVNAALAALALETPDTLRPPLDVLVSGIRAVSWPGRLQVVRSGGVTWILDVAHNVAGVEAVVTALRELALPRPLIAVVGVLGDKDWQHMLAPLYSVAERVILTDPPTAPPERRWHLADVLAVAPRERTHTVRDFTDALQHARDAAHAAHGCVLVTGSFHTVGDALDALGLCTDGSDFRISRPRFRAPV